MILERMLCALKRDTISNEGEKRYVKNPVIGWLVQTGELKSYPNVNSMSRIGTCTELNTFLLLKYRINGAIIAL